MSRSSSIARGRGPALGPQLAPQLPQLREEALVERLPEVRDPVSPAGPAPTPDLALDHQRVTAAPFPKRLVVRHEILADREELGPTLAVLGDSKEAATPRLRVVRRHRQTGALD